MQRNLSIDNELLVISDTGVYVEHGIAYGFGPVVKEIEVFLTVFNTITWIAFNRSDQMNNPSYLPITNKNCNIITLPNVGGDSLRDKFNIVKKYPLMWRTINENLGKNTFVHVRAPSNPAFITALLSFNHSKKKFWFKYAGSWIDKAPFFYRVQRFLLKNLKNNCTITVNGAWQNKSDHILAFENPCLFLSDRKKGKEVVLDKSISGIKKYCFIGGLNTNKGVLKALKAIKGLANNLNIEFHIVGTGPLKGVIESEISSLKPKVIWYGALPKKQVHTIYENCHFLILPSKSEGFPKVVSEAMNFGCIPIVSKVSCIDQYIKNDINGYLIEPNSMEELQKVIKKSYRISCEAYNSMILKNYNIAELFTYSNYIKRVKNDIFKIS